MRLMFSTLRFPLIFSLVVLSFAASAQGDSYKNFKPLKTRELFHDYVDKEQRSALRADGKADNQFTGSGDDDINYLVTQALVQKVDELQYKIETDSAIAHGKKVAYLRGLEKMLRTFAASVPRRSFNPANWPQVVETYQAAIDRDKFSNSVDRIIESKPYEVANMMVVSGAFDNNIGFKSTRYALLRKFAYIHPDRILPTLKDNMDVPFRDSLIILAAYKDPGQLYDYASANNPLGWAIRKIDDPLVKAVSRMATSGGNGQMYFPFLDAILRGKLTIDQINQVKDDDVKYYKLLVKTRMDYWERLRNKEQVYEVEGLNDKLRKKANDVFIKEINGLHESPDAVRFRILHQLTAPELYYVAISGEDEIYTSSYTKGVFPIMMQKIGNRGDSLMVSVGFDRFKKFIKMAAGYNTLNDFLKSFPNQDDARALMTAFVNGLEKSTGLEDGVDVADSYVGIAEGNKQLAKYVLDLAHENLEKNMAQNNHRGTVMYNLLYKLFLSADSNSLDLSKEFGIPPVYNVSYSSLARDSQKVVMQVYFYGDEDGRNNYAGFMRQFSGSNWKVIADNRNWVAISSTRGKPILIYANKPLNEEEGKDEEAQNALLDYLDKKGIEPTIIIHRGHSYYAPYTIAHIKPSAKIVFLGSCGGYHLLHDVLTHAPEAHIIASKQIGKTVINQPFFNLLMEKLRNGNNIDWIPFWNEFKRSAGSVEGFEDYIPPHKNLGAIFIKAYNSQMGVTADDEE